MSEFETPDIVDEIQALVSDKLQVVSYKWLSRNFLLPSNDSKRLLEKFVERHGNGLEVVYSLSGWLRNNLSVYHIKLVSGAKLEEAKREFDGNCSVQVYSVQASIPKDPAALWNAEFVQAEELFRQPRTVENCLRDNRFCGISNSFVKRNLDGTASSIALPQSKFAGKAVSSRTVPAAQNMTIPQTESKKVKQSGTKVGLRPSNVVKDVKTESKVTEKLELAEGPSNEDTVPPQMPANKRKGQNEKSTSGSGSSLANMWGRASAKSKANSVISEAITTSNLNSHASAEAEISALEAEVASSDDDGQQMNFKRASNGEGSRKRRVVFNLSDEEGEFKDAVNLASPDPLKRKSFGDQTKPKALFLEEKLDVIDSRNEDKPEVKEEKTAKRGPNQLPVVDLSVAGRGKTAEVSSTNPVNAPEDTLSAKKELGAGSTSPKRRKVLKTRIDERGREVTEVVWEGDEKETKADSNILKKLDETDEKTATRALPLAKKSPAMVGAAPANQGSKAGNKKAGNSKDPKQGSIMSFFKKKV